LVDQKNIFGSQVSAIGSQARVIRFGYGYGSWTCTWTRIPEPGTGGPRPGTWEFIG